MAHSAGRSIFQLTSGLVCRSVVPRLQSKCTFTRPVASLFHWGRSVSADVAASQTTPTPTIEQEEIQSDATVDKPKESRNEFIQRVKTDTRKSINYDLFLKDLQERLENNKYVKATDINITCYNTKPGKLDSVKDLLHLYRRSPSLVRDSVASVVVSMCLRLGAPEVAVEIITDPRRYGIFPTLKTMNGLMLDLSKKGDVEGIEKLCEVKKAVDMNKGWYELQYKIRARMVSMLVRHGKLSQSSISGVSEVGGDETNKEGEPGALSESEGDADKAPPSQESSELGDEQVLSEEAMKEELTVILEMCKLNLDRKRLDSALPYFYVHGLLMKSELYSLAKYVLDKVEEEKTLEDQLRLNLWLDHHMLQSRHSEVLQVLQLMKERNCKIAQRRKERVRRIFQDCSNADLKEEFQKLDLDQITKSSSLFR